MKRFLAVLGCALISLCCVFAASCVNDGNKSLFVFLSVRMKGNGDGTVTAVAQNEFSLIPAVLPVTLTLYISDSYQTDVGNMTELESLTSEDLNLFNKLKILAEVQTQSYYCARLAYEVNGETRYIQSDTVGYDTQGKRIK